MGMLDHLLVKEAASSVGRFLGDGLRDNILVGSGAKNLERFGKPTTDIVLERAADGRKLKATKEVIADPARQSLASRFKSVGTGTERNIYNSALADTYKLGRKAVRAAKNHPYIAAGIGAGALLGGGALLATRKPEMNKEAGERTMDSLAALAYMNEMEKQAAEVEPNAFDRAGDPGAFKRKVNRAIGTARRGVQQGLHQVKTDKKTQAALAIGTAILAGAGAGGYALHRRNKNKDK